MVTAKSLAEAVVVALSVLVGMVAADEAAAANLTLHNLCPFPVWPVVTANAGLPGIPVDADGEPVGRLDGNGEGLATLAFPGGAWSGRVTARTGCAEDEDDDGGAAPTRRCRTGESPPVTVAQVSVGGPGGLAAYSVSLVDGFNVAVAITPHGFAQGRRCPTLGCAVDLGGKAAGEFKRLCPDTRTNATDVEATPQDCVAPRELKVVFCPKQGSVAVVVNQRR